MKEIINNDKLPKGNKFYPVSNHYASYEDDCYVHNLKKMLHKDYYEIVSKVYNDIVITHDKSVNQILHLDNIKGYMEDCTILTDEEYPVFKVNKQAINLFLPEACREVAFKKNYHGGSKRIKTVMMDIPASDDFIYMQWCNKRKGIIIHNQVFEGSFKSNGSAKLNKEINEIIQDIIGQAQMLELLNSTFEVDRKYRYCSASQKKSVLEKLIPKFISNTATDEEIFGILSVAGRIETKWDYASGKTIYSLDLRRLNDKIEIPPTLRTKLIYMYGGYTLPDNYEEWFDG